MMNQTQEVLLKLVSIASSGKPVDIPNNVNWQEVIALASSQGVFATCFDALELLPSDHRPRQTELLSWLGQTIYQEKVYNHSWNVAKKLDALWSSAGVEAVLLKGRSIAQYYPKPEHRYSCDLDVFIPDDGQWKKACESLEKKGVKLEYEIYKEAEFTYDGVYVECHRYITPVRGNKVLQRFEKYLRLLLTYDDKEYFVDTHLVKPSLMFTTMLFIEHALWDSLHGKLTLKHVADWMMLRKQQLDVYTLNARCKEFGFDRFKDLLDSLAFVVAGEKDIETLPKSYRRAFSEIFEERKKRVRNKSFTARRVRMFFDILKCGWKYKSFGYCSMTSFLVNALWTHWFAKEVKL